MTASDLFHSGKLREAIDLQIQKVKTHPADQAARLFLFELLLFTGDIDRARKHLDLLNYENPQAMAAVEAYRKSLDAEAYRRQVLSGSVRPNFMKPVGEHVELRLQALGLMANNQSQEAEQLVHRANDEAPVVNCTLNEEAVQGIRDADDLFGNVLEVFAGDKYCWVPFEDIQALTLNEPSHPRDILWRPAHLELKDGPSGDVLLPGIYPGSHENSEQSIVLGRVTDWIGEEQQPVRGVGAKLFVAGDRWVTLNDWRDFAGQS